MQIRGGNEPLSLESVFTLSFFRSRLSEPCKLKSVVKGSPVDLAKSHPICFDRH